jgi:hypothetical protein
MVGTTRRRLGVTVAMGLVVAGAVAASSLTAGADPVEVELAPPVKVGGTLTIILEPDRTGRVELKLDDGSKTVTQDIRVQEPCNKLAFEPLVGGDLLDLKPFSTAAGEVSVQVPSNYLGVHAGNTNCGGPAGQIGHGETLRFALGSYLTSRDVKATSAVLFIRKTHKDDGDLRYWLNDENGKKVLVPIGIGTSGYPVTPESPAKTLTSITLESTVGPKNTSRGLSVGTETSIRLENLESETQFEASCGETIVQEGETGDIATKVVFFRGQNDPIKTELAPPDEVEECAEVLTTVQIVPGVPEPEDPEDEELGYVYWDNVVVDGQPVNATVTIEWAPVPVADAGRLNRQIDYVGVGPFRKGEFTRWCESFVTDGLGTFNVILPDYDGEGAIDVAVVDEDGDVVTDGEGNVVTEKKAPWCLVSDERVLDGGLIYQTQVLFGSGDPKNQ